jgi:hypothetical protein
MSACFAWLGAPACQLLLFGVLFLGVWLYARFAPVPDRPGEDADA